MRRFFLLPILFLISINLSGKHLDSLYSSKLDSIKNYSMKLMKKYHIPGMSITVMKDSNIIMSKQYGYTDLSSKATVNKNTKFRIASLSKVITSAAVMKLLEENKIDLDSNIRKYVPAFTKKKWDIPVRYLLNHTSGIRHYKGNEFYSPGNYQTIQSAVDIFNKDTLLFEPGTKVYYSSYGYNLLGAMIENVSRKSFNQFVFENLLNPAKCRSIVPDNNEIDISNKTKFYMYDKDSVIVECPKVDMAYKLPTGGYLSTSDDFAKLTYNLFCGSILNDSIVKLYKSDTYLKDRSDTKYCNGLRFSEVKNHKIFWHLGSTYGASSAVAIDPKRKITIVWLTNINIKWSDEPILQLMEYLE